MSEVPRNPFLPPATETAPAQVIEPDAVLGDSLEVRGPSSPLHPPREGRARAAAAGPVSAGAALVIGLHGGAGASTLSQLLGDAVTDGGTDIPAPNPYVPAKSPAVLVARAHARGLAAAEEATTAWSHHELDAVTVVGLVLIDDGPKLSAETRQAISRLLHKTPHGWHIPWVEAWRTTSSPSVRGVRMTLTMQSIRRALGVPASPKGPSK